MLQEQLERVVGAIRAHHDLQRISGGSETDVYRTQDGHYVIKVKPLAASSVQEACAEIATMQAAAISFATYLGTEHSIDTHFALSEDHEEQLYAVAIQRYLDNASPLATIDYGALNGQQRTQVEWQLLFLLRQSLHCYHETGHMPDLYGTFSRNIAERRRMNTPFMWPRRVWLFFTQRLWSAHNLMMMNGNAPRIVLVDYDQVRWRGLWGKLYYAVCYLLFWRDLLWLVGRHTNTSKGSRMQWLTTIMTILGKLKPHDSSTRHDPSDRAAAPLHPPRATA